MSGQIANNPILTDLSERIAQPVSADDIARARLHLIDWMGCAVAGSQTTPGKVLRAQASGDRLSQSFTWGGLGNILEMDDVDKRALLHPGPSIIPAALISAGSVSASINTVLDSIVRGYDATIRLGRAVGTGHYSLFHSTGTCGALGAAAASATLIGLNSNECAHAMALAVSQSAGLWHTRHDPQSMGKQLHTAAAARAGLHAAQLANAGFRGPLEILEGEQGFFEAMCPEAAARDVLKSYRHSWLIHDVSFKPWPACRHAHAVIDAALALAPQMARDPAQSITVRTYGDALKFCDQPTPKTEIEAKFSLQHAVAVALACGEPQLDDFTPERIDSPELKAIRDRVNVCVSDDYDRVYPARFGAEIEAGNKIVRVPDALGDPENPMAETQICDKAAMLIQSTGKNSEQAQKLIELVRAGDEPVGPLLHCIREALS